MMARELINLSLLTLVEDTHFLEEIPLIFQKGTIVTSLGDCLRTAQIEVHSITDTLHILSGLQKGVRVISTELK